MVSEKNMSCGSAGQTFYSHHSEQIEAKRMVIRKCQTHLDVLASVYTSVPVIHGGKSYCKQKWHKTEYEDMSTDEYEHEAHPHKYRRPDFLF